MKEAVELTDIWAKRYPIFSVPDASGGYQHRVHILTYVEDPEEFSEVISLIQTASEKDSILLVINSRGGDLYSTMMLVDAINHCNAPVYAQISGMVASAATMITLACDDVYVAPHTTFMIHNFSGGTYGKGHEIEASVDSLLDTTKKFYNDIYKDFLSKKEIKKVIAGKDIYLTSEEVDERFNYSNAKRIEIASAEVAELETAQQEEMIAYLKNSGYKIKKAK